MMHIKELARLSEGAEERVVAAGALFILVKTDGCTFGMLHGRQDASVEVQCGSRQSLLPEADKYHVLRHRLEIQSFEERLVDHKPAERRQLLSFVFFEHDIGNLVHASDNIGFARLHCR
jgi:hypothetical protein